MTATAGVDGQIPLLPEVRPIPGFPGYTVSTDGVVYGLSGKPLSPHPIGPYLRVSPRQRAVMVHRLVALAFLGPPPDGKTQVNHVDGDPSNNSITNLEYVTPSENVRHSIDVLGRQRAPGVRNANAVFTDDDVREMRAAFDAGENCASIARRVGRDHTNVWRICTRRGWRHIT